MKKFLSLLIIFIICAGVFSGCKASLHMEDFVNVKWMSDDPVIELVVTEEHNRRGVGSIVYNNNDLEIFCIFTLSKTIKFYKIEDYDRVTEDYVYVALYGKYEMKKNTSIVTIETDNVFNGELVGKKITLTMHQLEE